MKPVIIVSTFPNKTITKKIANELVKKKLAACVNITKIDSVYSWKGKIQNDSEYLAIFKTTKKNEKTLKNEIKNSNEIVNWLKSRFKQYRQFIFN